MKKYVTMNPDIYFHIKKLYRARKVINYIPCG